MMTTTLKKSKKSTKHIKTQKNGDQVWKKCQTAISFFLTTP